MAVGDVLRYVRSGDPIEIPANTWNLVMDATRSHHGLRGKSGSQLVTSSIQDTIVRVKNNSGEDRERFEVLALDGVIFGPDDNEEEFKNNFAFKGIQPTSTQKLGLYVVLLEPCVDATICLAMMAGVTVAELTVNNEYDEYCECEDGEYRLQSRPIGSSRILWKEDGAGDVLGIVHLGAGCLSGCGKLNGTLARNGSAMVSVYLPGDSGGMGDDSGLDVTVVDIGQIPASVSPLPTNTVVSFEKRNHRWVLSSYDCDAI